MLTTLAIISAGIVGWIVYRCGYEKGLAAGAAISYTRDRGM